MKEIKFRAWDKEKKQMWVGQFTIAGKDGEILDYEQNARPEWVLMQFTGLKDKNGKEIYEGDITEQSNAYKGFKKETGVVKWWDSTAKFMVSGEFATWNFPLNQYAGDFEIIGNIYENPELLTPKPIK